MLRHLSLIFKNALRNRRRSSLTILSIAASLCLLTVLMVLAYAMLLAPANPEQAMRLIVRNRVSLANPLPISYRERIRQVPGVREATIFQWFGGTYKDARDPANFFGRFATEPEKLATVYPEYLIPDDQRKAFLGDRTGALVGRKTATRHNLKIGDRVQIVGDIFPVTLDLTIRAIYDATKDNENLIFHFEFLNQALMGSGRKDQVGTFIVLMDSPDNATRIASTVDGLFRNAPLQTKTETERAFELSFLAFLGNVKVYLAAICSAVVFTILLVAGNTMAMSVRERTREVGVLKTIGFTPSGILSLILGESILISLLGGLIGVGLAYGLCEVLRSGPSTFADVSRFRLSGEIIALSLASAVLIGLVSSFVPAWGASRRSIIDALRFND
ncbi:MAG: ABC transporter permease [Bryobacteraceae bacterium]